MVDTLPQNPNWPHLWSLRLSKNNLTGEIPESYTMLEDLGYLYIHENNLDRNAAHDARVTSTMTNWANQRVVTRDDQ